MTASGSDDLPREFVNVLLPLMPEVADDLLRAHHDRGFGELFLLLDHAPLLGRHARDRFLRRVTEVRLPVSSAELIAAAALGVPPEERGPFRDRALAVIAAETRPDDRIGALLKWAQAEPADVARGLIDEALTLVPRVAPPAVARLVRCFRDAPDAAVRKALLDRIQRIPRAKRSPDLLLARCALSPPDRRAAIADEAIERAAETPRPGFIITAIEAMDLVGFEPVRPWFERHLRELGSLRDLDFMLRRVGERMPPGMLDLAEQRARSMDEDTRRTVEWRAALSRLRPERRAALLAELRPLVDRVVGDPLAGHRMRPDEYSEYDNLDVLRASVAMAASPAFEGDERRALQRRALAIVERTDSGVEQRYELDGLPWGELGASLDPPLRAEAARVALTIRHRPSALKALGELVATLPEESRHLALLGMARLADGAAPEGLARALAALEAATALPARRGGGGGAAERKAVRADLGRERGVVAPMRHELEDIARRLEAVRGDGEAEWSERVAGFFDAQAWDAERMLEAVELFAPALKGLGGAEMVRELMARLREPIAPAEIARPWTQAAVGDFQA